MTKQIIPCVIHRDILCDKFLIFLVAKVALQSARSVLGTKEEKTEIPERTKATVAIEKINWYNLMLSVNIVSSELV